MTAVAVYDALGLPPENLKEEEIAARLPTAHEEFLRCPETHPCHAEHFPGRWSDDTQMTLSVAKAIQRAEGEIRMGLIAEEHVKAYDETTFGWGGASREGAENLKKYVPFYHSGKRGSLGNGVLMKMAPLAMTLEYGERKYDKNSKLELIAEFTRMTHSTIMAVVCSAVHNEMLQTLMKGNAEYWRSEEGQWSFLNKAADKALEYEAEFGVPVNEGVLSGKLLHLVEKIDFLNDNETLKEVSDGGFCMAPDTLTMVYGLFAADPTMAAAHRAVRIGGDTDSNASIVASMVALIDDDKEAIPKKLREGVWRKEEIKKAAKEFAAALNRRS